jgi:hypothetical protein
MDVAYYQVTSPNNYLRPICPYVQNGTDQYHCVGAPNNLDVWRDALFLGALFTSSRVRVIGVDGKVGPLVLQAMATLCANNWLPQSACTTARSKLAYEETDMGRGWFQFHHHHQHISLSSTSPFIHGDPSDCLIEDGCLRIDDAVLKTRLGHAHELAPRTLRIVEPSLRLAPAHPRLYDPRRFGPTRE